MREKASQKTPLRSSQWFGLTDRDGFIHRSWMKNQGFPHDVFEERPVIGICNTWSELTPCNHHFRKLAEHVKPGVWQAGGFPLEFPEHVLQADRGVDLDFLVGKSGTPRLRESH